MNEIQNLSVSVCFTFSQLTASTFFFLQPLTVTTPTSAGAPGAGLTVFFRMSNRREALLRIGLLKS